MSAPGGQMSQLAVQLQNKIVQDPTKLGQYMTAYNEGKLPPAEAAAWTQLMSAASLHSQNPGNPANGQFIGSSTPFVGVPGMTPPAVPPTRQSSHPGQPMPQWQNMQAALPPAAPGVVTSEEASKTAGEFNTLRAQGNHLEAYMRRSDLNAEQRASAQASLATIKTKTATLGTRLQAIVQANPTLMPVVQAQLRAPAAGQAPSAAPSDAGAASDSSHNFQLQQQQLMRTRNQSLVARGAASGPGGNQGPPRANTPAQAQSGAAPSIVPSSHSMGLPPVNPHVPKDLISEARPEPFANVGRPTLNQGLASQTSVGSPAIVQAPPSHPSTGLPGAGLGAGGLGGFGGSGPAGPDPYALRAVNKRKLADLVASVDPAERLEPEVEELLLEVADEFIESVTKAACRLAQHRKADRLETRDVQLHLEHAWNMRIPGFAADDVRVSQNRRLNLPPSHTARLAVARDTARRRA